MAEDKKNKAKKILENNFEDLTLEKLEGIWENKICAADGQPFATEINKLKKYFPCLDCDGKRNGEECVAKEEIGCKKNGETFSDGRYGGSVFDDMKISTKDKDKLKNAVKPDTPIAKLFYAMSWKNGDLNKELIIIDGINNKAKDKVQTVFYQFGRFLETLPEKNSKEFSKVEPIIDQHTLRAFVYLQHKKSDEGRDEYEKIKDTIPTDIASTYWDAYREWYNAIVEKCGGTEQAFWLLNHIMFVLGKAIKP